MHITYFKKLSVLLWRIIGNLLEGLLVVFFVSAPVLASDSADQNKAFCGASQSGCIAVGKWDIALGLGAGLRSNPLIDGDDLPLFVLPQVRYYGERLFIDTDTVGFTFYETADHFFNAVATIGFDQLYFKTRSVGNLVIASGPFVAESEETFSEDEFELNQTDLNGSASALQEGIIVDRLHKRSTAGLMGFEYGFYRHLWEISLQTLQDFTRVHDGQEVRAAVARFFNVADESIELTGGFTWQSKDLLQYYYGIDKDEVPEPSWSYHADAGVSPFLRVDWRRQISGHWSWQATVHQRWLSSEITESPLLDEDRVLTVYLGGVYHF